VPSNFVVFRNCFTGDKSGGDIHSLGVFNWISKNTNSEITIIKPADDGSEATYVTEQSIKFLQYKRVVKIRNYALDYVVRAIQTSLVGAVPHDNGTIYVASSHFLPDVLPAYLVSLRHKKNTLTRAVYIHHIIQDMKRPAGLSNSLAELQEKINFAIIKRKFTKIIVVNHNVKARLVELGFNENYIGVASNFIDNIAPESDADKKYDFAFCGRFVKQKGVYDLLKVVENLRNESREVSAVMIGGGAELVKLNDQIKAKKLNVKVLNNPSDKVKMKAVAESKYFLFPSYEEGWGIVIGEALGAGVPVIAYDLPVYGEVFEGGELSTVNVGDVASLTGLAGELLRCYDLDEKTYTKLSVRLKEYSSRFLLSDIAEQEYVFLTGSTE
jgi:glycosyltransferase involved in cell wall biosynthesis